MLVIPQEEKIFQIGEAASAAFLFTPHPEFTCVHADSPTRPFSGIFPLLAAVGYKWPAGRQEKHLVHPYSFLPERMIFANEVMSPSMLAFSRASI